MSSTTRATSYISRPSERWQQLKDSLNTTTLFLMARNGPCVFSIGDESGRSYRSILGNPSMCSCNALRANGTHEPCIHILFCLVKVLRVRDDHPLQYQTSFVDSELDQLLNGTFSQDNRINSHKIVRETIESTESPDGFVSRHSIEEEELQSCPICQDDMAKDQPLTWCRKGCGNNMHSKCMKTYTQYNIAKKNEPQCPYCRAPWLMEYLKQDCRGQERSNVPCSTVSCISCTLSVRGIFYRCIECSQNNAFSTNQESGDGKRRKLVDYCQGCFGRLSKGKHPANHHFVKSEGSVKTLDDVCWIVTSNPTKNPMDLEVLYSLQNRDINTNDYELLLNLEGNRDILPLPQHVVQALPSAEGSQISNTCWCRAGEVSDEGNERQEPSKTLPCGHRAHVSCLLDIISAAGDDMVYIDKMNCLHEGCNCVIFRGLNRRKREKKLPNDSASKSAESQHAQDIDHRSKQPIGKLLSMGRLVGNSSGPNLNPFDSMIAINGVGMNGTETAYSHPHIESQAHFKSKSLKLPKIRRPSPGNESDISLICVSSRPFPPISSGAERAMDITPTYARQQRGLSATHGLSRTTPAWGHGIAGRSERASDVPRGRLIKQLFPISRGRQAMRRSQEGRSASPFPYG